MRGDKNSSDAQGFHRRLRRSKKDDEGDKIWRINAPEAFAEKKSRLEFAGIVLERDENEIKKPLMIKNKFYPIGTECGR